MEIWKDVEGYEGLYEVSNLGRIRRDGMVLSANRNPKSGYLSVQLCKDGKLKRLYIHRLVATAFIQNPQGFRCVNHKDEIKQNNCVENLEWCTQKYNNRYGKNAPAFAREKPVVQKDDSGTIIRFWKCATEVERVLGIKHQHISHCCIGTREHCGGYRWEYA